MQSNTLDYLKDINLQPHNTVLHSPIGAFCMVSLVDGAGLLLANDALAVSAYASAMGFVVYLVGTLLTARGLLLSYPHTVLGLCNIVTFTRLMIVCILFAALIGNLAPSWITLALALVALALDGIDGWLARKQGLASDFGARFDVEVDAIFALVLAIFAASNGAAGAYVILLGLPYYFFGIARLGLPWLNGPLPERFSRKAICVIQIGVLIALQVPALADGHLDLLVLGAASALVWSFGRDILWLSRNA